MLFRKFCDGYSISVGSGGCAFTVADTPKTKLPAKNNENIFFMIRLFNRLYNSRLLTFYNQKYFYTNENQPSPFVLS